jgi:hypothetical protein
MLKLYDNIPVLELPDGRRALADTGCSGADVLMAAGGSPVTIDGRVFEPVHAPVDLDGIAREIGAPGIDMLLGANLLHEGFTADLCNGTFEFSVSEERACEELIAAIPYTRPGSGLLCSPLVKFEISGVDVTGVFDTGAPYSLWKHRYSEPERPARVKRRDFHVATGGKLVEFPVVMRKESVRVGRAAFDLDVAYLPESWPAHYPDCVFGMDIPEVIGAARFMLDPRKREIRFYCSR